MIIDVPNRADFEEQGLTLLNLAWDTVTELLLEYRDGEEWAGIVDDEQSEHYSKASQKPLGIATVLLHLEADDIVIDGGNSYYIDDIRRAKELALKKMHYVASPGILGRSNFVIYWTLVQRNERMPLIPISEICSPPLGGHSCSTCVDVRMRIVGAATISRDITAIKNNRSDRSNRTAVGTHAAFPRDDARRTLPLARL